jgi:Na+/phosphate symporter
VRVEERLAGLIRDWQTSARPSAERLEDALTQLERLLDENLRTCFSAIELNNEEQHARQQLAAYKKRMTPTTYETTLAHILVKRLRERRNVPRLSLFHL